ncbi:hypothetical protein RvY_07326-2 [Ramazzottius varieornatus]|uniref:G-protein coupled receptors family 1 profile domain-containing protein n=1 Tax=Ramazzottius varieornatus TaxID=947166 RepID=A0A1D1V1Y5_RAMVA|nr:hypothetical protein RvY_07326-2 [Ramazzottius varieornatus]
MASRKIQIHVLFSLSFLAIVGNSAVILNLVRKRIRGRSFGNIDHLILQLAISDLLVGFFCLAADGAWKYTYWWLAGNSACKFVKFMQMLALYCSTYTIVSIAIDRCIAIRASCGLSRTSHRQVVKIMSLFACTMSVFCSLPQIYIFRSIASPFDSENGFHEQCVTYGAYTEEWQEPAYILFTCAAMFILPLIIIIISYTLIFKKIHDESEFRSEVFTHGVKRVAFFYSAAGDHRDALMKKAKMKALCVSMLVIVTFLLCWGKKCRTNRSNNPLIGMIEAIKSKWCIP